MKFRLLFITAVMLVVTGLALANVAVTYRVNTAAVTRALITDSTHVVQVCGAEVGPEGQDLWQNNFLTWDDTSPLMTNVAGDYWALTISYPDSMIGWRMAYKIRFRANEADAFEWENHDNRMWVLPAQDTTLSVVYADSDTPPFTETDSVDVFFRLNMSAYADFNPEIHTPSIVGHLAEWAPGKLKMTREGTSRVYHITLRYAQGYIDTVDQIKFDAGWPDTEIGMHMYRYVSHGEDWGNSENLGGAYFPGNENRTLYFHPGMTDTTIAWVWWNDTPPAVVDHADTVIVTFQANMSKALTNRGFAHGDTLQVRYGYFGTGRAVRTAMMTRQGFTNVYTATDTVVTTVGGMLDYQYYIIKNGAEFREIYYNFYYEGETQGEQERRLAEVSGNPLTVQDLEDSQNELHRMPVFRNTDVLSKDVLVTYTCDLRPAYFNVKAGKVLDDIQGPFDITDAETIMGMGVAMNGPASGNWDTWGVGLMATDQHKMYDDGTHGDALAGDSVFTMQIQYNKDSLDVIGQEFKFGIGGGDNEGGEGGYGNNHIQNIDDTQSTYTIHAQFGSINPVFYGAWDYDNPRPPTATAVEDGAAPLTFSLKANYPNPFNPTTMIEYSLAHSENVVLAIYNMMGQEVTRLVNEVQNAGEYKVSWNALNAAGKQVSAGIYFFKIEAGAFTKTHKMLFLK